MMWSYLQANEVEKGLALFNDIITEDWIKIPDSSQRFFSFFFELLEKNGQQKNVDNIVKHCFKKNILKLNRHR
eukprot:UN02946